MVKKLVYVISFLLIMCPIDETLCQTQLILINTYTSYNKLQSYIIIFSNEGIAVVIHT